MYGTFEGCTSDDGFFSLTGGGIFLYFIFAKDDDKDIAKSTVKIVYTVFTGVTVVGGVIMAFLPMPSSDRLITDENEREEEQQKLTQKELLGNLFINHLCV